MSRLRVAVFGAGHMGRIHTRLLQTQEVDLVGIVDPCAEARQAITQEFKVKAYADLEQLPGPIDAAIVATPTVTHRDIGSHLLSQGVHLFVEKPLACSTSDARRLIGLAEKHDLVLQVGHVERFNPAFVAARELAEQPVFISATRTSNYTFRSVDIGAVLDIMIHDLDLILALTDSAVVSVEAVGDTIVGPHEDLVHARLKFASGCIANLTASRVSRQSQRSMQIYNRQRCLDVDFAQSTVQCIEPTAAYREGSIQFAGLDEQQQERLRCEFYGEVLATSQLDVTAANAILNEQCEFIDCIQNESSPQVSGHDAYQTLIVAERLLYCLDNQVVGRQMPTTTETEKPAIVSVPHWPSLPQPADSPQRKAG